MKTLQQVLDEANASFEEGMKSRPDIYKEKDDGRTFFILGALKAAYEELYNEAKSKKK